MKTNQIFYGIGLLILLLIVYLVFFSSTPPGYYDEFAQCLSDNGAKLYGTFWCPHCNEQKEAFGDSIQYVNYIECSTPDGQGRTTVCVEANVESYPTWEFADGSRVTGVVPLYQLSEKTGCPLNNEG